METLQRIGEQLAEAVNVDQVWQTTLKEAVCLLDVDEGAWVWNTPLVQVVSSAKPPRFSDQLWYTLTASGPDSSEPCVFLGAYDQSSSLGVLRIPINLEPWLGWLILVREAVAFSLSDLELIVTVVEMTRLTVLGWLRYDHAENTRIRQVQELAVLQHLSRAIGESLDLEATLQLVLNSLLSLVSYDAGEITLFDPEQNALISQANYSNEVIPQSVQLKGTRYELGEGLSGWLATNRRPLLINNTLEFQEIQPKNEALKKSAQSYLGIPLLVQNDLVGTLEIASAHPNHFSEHDKEIAELFGEQAAVAMANACLYTKTDVELHWRLDALETLQRVTRAITTTVELDFILQQLLQEAIRFSHAQAGFIVLLKGQTVEFRASQGYDDEILANVQALATDARPGSFTAHFIEHEELLYLQDVQDTSWHIDQSLPGARSLLVTPVFYEQRLVAALLLQSSEPHAFNTTCIEFVTGLAVQGSIAIGNDRRYQEQLQRGELIRKRAEQMTFLLEVSRTMRSDRPLEDILLDVAYAVQEGTGFNVVLISVLEGSHLRRVAGAGIPLSELKRMKNVLHTWSRIKTLFQEEYRLGQCYYIPAEADILNGIDTFAQTADFDRQPGFWHRMDSFIIPLRGSRGDIVGLMSVDDPVDGRIPTASTAEVVELFATQVALAIENNRLVEDLRRQVNTLRLFNELSRSITTKLDLPLVLNTVVQAVTNLLDYDYATIYVQDRTGQYLVPMASSGYSLDLLGDVSYQVGTGLVGHVAQMGMPLVVDETRADPRFVPTAIPVGSSVMVPLTVEGRSVGVLSAERKEIGDFTPTDVATLTSLADQVAVAVENTRLFDEVKRFSVELEERVTERTQELAEALEDLRVQRDRSEVLYHISSELVASLDIDHVLSQALMLLQKAVRASKSAVILLDNNTGALIYRAAIGHTEPIPPGGRPASFTRDEGVVGWVMQQKKPLIIADLHESKFEVKPTDALIRSVLAVPILGNTGESLGVILLQSPIADAFDETGLQLAEAAAIQLGNALNNAELYRLIREQAERLGAMLRTQQVEAAKNQAILEGIADGVMVSDANGRVILFNAAAEHILSITRTQALGRFQDDILGLYGSAARDWLEQVDVWKQDPKTHSTDKFLAHRLEVGRKVVSVHLSPVVTPRHEFLGVVSVFRDITAEVEADRAKSEFVSTVSHELRTPMTSIVGYVDLVVNGATGPLTDMQSNFLKKVKTNADRLTALVNDLLDISRIETGRIELQRAPVAIESIIEQVMDLLRPKVAEKEQTLHLEAPPALPKVYGDPARLTQILTNLIGNAHKYTPAGGNVRVYAYVRDTMMHVAVVDTGIGIAPENQRKIFERFYRVENDPAVYEVSGTGLGLAISLSLIQMHGGDIWLESKLGEGSIFTFSIPLAEGEPTEVVGEAPVGFAEPAVPEYNILVVEDDAEFANTLQSVLKHIGYKTLLVTSGEDALRLARERLPDLISMDVRLPDLSGFEVLQLLKRDSATADIPVVIVSVVQDKEYGMHLGAAAYLTKPIEAEPFCDTVKRILEKRGPVLIANEDREMLDVVRSAMQAEGVGVYTARSGDMALKLAVDLHPRLMLVDLGLPDINGYQVLQNLKRDPATANIPVIVTADGAINRMEELQDLGIMHCLTKPFSVTELVAEVSDIINGNGTHKE
ncbi:MAG: GAF domain-containing protein [Anaerolineae bacterium]|nr:GAF domain-containing protein [Anaerolineae bacterium]